jgi:plasmid stability protein
MEEEARQILRTALDESRPASPNLAQRIRSRFAKLGDVKLPITAREPVRYLEMLICGGSLRRLPIQDC